MIMARAPLRTETFPFGIASLGLGKVERQVLADDLFSRVS